MDNALLSVFQLINTLNIRITITSLKEKLTSHPNYPSLLSISDTLNDFQIVNEALNIKDIMMHEVTFPVIVHLKNNTFVVVEEVGEGKVICLDENNKKKIIAPEDFNKMISGTILLVDGTHSKGDLSYAKNRLIEIFNIIVFPISITLLCLLFIYFLLSYTDYDHNFNLNIGLITLLKSLGLLVSVMLLAQSFRLSYAVSELCTITKTDCNSVLNSNQAKILFGTVSLSEIGLFYFSGTLGFYLFNTTNESSLCLLAIINLLSLPFTLYSLYSQKFILKKWCVFCCIIQLLLWLEFTQLVRYVKYEYLFLNTTDTFNLLISFSVPVFVWLILKPLLLKAKESDANLEQLNAFKKNESLFSCYLNLQVNFSILKDEHSFITGDANSKNTITLVANPYCAPCAKAYQMLESWCDSGADYRIQTVFWPSNDYESGLLITHLASVFNEDREKGKKALVDWFNFEDKDVKTFVDRHKINDYDYFKKNSREILDENFRWNTMVNIEYTPTIFLNGKKVPKEYDLKDIRYFI
jgi:uncharacterized membrane protein